MYRCGSRDIFVDTTVPVRTYFGLYLYMQRHLRRDTVEIDSINPSLYMIVYVYFIEIQIEMTIEIYVVEMQTETTVKIHIVEILVETIVGIYLVEK